MSLTASGQISMHDIRSELGASGEISLIEASDGTIATINTQNDADDRPDGSAPHAMSEFYSYDHDLAGTSWSVADNTGLNLADFPGQTATSTKDAQMTVNNGSGGTSCSLSTSGGPFGNFLHHQLIVIVYLLDTTLVQDLLEQGGNTLQVIKTVQVLIH